MPLPDLDALRGWIGRTEDDSDIAAPGPAALLAATLNRDRAPAAGDQLPMMWHWLYFLSPTATQDLGEDGMPRRGGFIPPVALPRRMWAGSRIEFGDAIRLGDRLHRRTTIADINGKEGRSGALVFVRVLTEIGTERGLALVEQRDIVFRDHPPPGISPSVPPQAPLPDATWREETTGGAVLLFRYSALTFNSHRIHYDQPYSTEVEGYPALVVQGPLLATLLADSLGNHLPATSIRAITFRAVSAIFVDEPFAIAGAIDAHKAVVWAAKHDDRLAMIAEAEIG
jgi:3-methylfumaryl-CoA hydratase